MPSILNVEWLNQNSGRAYPFQEDMRRRPTIDGAPADGYSVPNGLLLDFVMTTNFDQQPSVYMSSLTFTGSVVTIVIADASDSTPLAVASATYSGEDFSPVNFSGVGKHDDIRGTAVFGNISRLSEMYPDGVYSFDATETLLEARCCRPSIPCVSGIFVSNTVGSVESKRLRGDVALVAGDNVRIDYNEENNAIVINADSRYGYNDKCGCEAKDNRQEVLSINGISTSNVELEAGDCVSLEKQEGRIIISDTCSQPCCGCAELTFLNQKTNNIITSIGRLEAFSQELHMKLEDFVRNVLLSDRNLSQYL